MRYLVVFAHPLNDSYHTTLYSVVSDALISAGHKLDKLDLYKSNFQPILSDDERRSYNIFGANGSGVSEYAEQLKLADGLIMIFPTWYYGMPALMKGYLDRVWLPGVAFEIIDGRVRPLLTNIKRFCVVTCYGSSFTWNKLVMGEPNKKVLMRGVKALMPNAKALWLAQYGMDKADERARLAFIRKVREKFSKL